MDELTITKATCATLKATHENVTQEIVQLNPEKVEEHLQKYDQLLNKQSTLESDTKHATLTMEKNDIAYKSLNKEVENLYQRQHLYHKNKNIIESKEMLLRQSLSLEKDIKNKKKAIQKCEEQKLELYKEHGSLEQKLNSLEEQKQELADLREDYAAYDLFKQCMHSNGISYDIIKRKLPAINNEIAKVLANVVNFEIFFENDGRHLKILIKHPSHEPRPIEMGSGAEKTIAAMAIRLALLSVSNLPKSNIFILDEPGTALDADNMDGFIRILDLVKSYF